MKCNGQKEREKKCTKNKKKTHKTQTLEETVYIRWNLNCTRATTRNMPTRIKQVDDDLNQIELIVSAFASFAHSCFYFAMLWQNIQRWMDRFITNAMCSISSCSFYWNNIVFGRLSVGAICGDLDSFHTTAKHTQSSNSQSVISNRNELI